MNVSPPSISGRRGSTMTTSGRCSAARSSAAPARPALPTTIRRSPMASRPVRLSRTRSSASTTRTRSAPIGPGHGIGHDLMVGPGGGRRKRPSTEPCLGGTTVVPYVIRRGSRASPRARPWHACAASPAEAATCESRKRLGSEADLDRGALARPARHRRTWLRPARRGRACRRARGGRRARPPGRSPCRRPRPAAGRRRRRVRTSTRTCRAAACLTTLWSASWAMRYRTSSAASGSRSSRSLSTTIGRPSRPCNAAVCVLSARTRPSCSRLPGRSSKIERAHLGEGLALELAELVEVAARRLRVRGEQHLDGARHQGHREQRLRDRVVQLARQVRPFLAGRQLAGLAAQLALEADLVADVARSTLDPGEPAVDADADRTDVDRRPLAVRTAQDLRRLDLPVGVGREGFPAAARDLDVLRLDDRAEMRADELHGAVAGQAFDGRRDEREVAVDVGREHDVR